jgi:hypothetical protein
VPGIFGGAEDHDSIGFAKRVSRGRELNTARYLAGNEQKHYYEQRDERKQK